MPYLSSDAGDSNNFQKEVSNMMHGFGDNPNPNPGTVVLIESIVLQQLQTLLEEALQIAIERGKTNISNYEIIYLMRKNILKLRQLHEYQLKMDIVFKTNLPGQAFTDDELLFLGDDTNIKMKPKRNHIDIIRELDEIGDVKQVNFQAIDQIRKIRAAKLTEHMSQERYDAFHKARCSSFRNGTSFSKGFTKLERWLNPNKEYKITVLALEVLGFLAYETVAEIVDAVFLIRQDAKKKQGDPFSKYEGGFFGNPGVLQNATYIKSGYEGCPAITVAEVREAIRRYFTPTVGLNGHFYRNMNLDVPVRFLAF